MRVICRTLLGLALSAFVCADGALSGDDAPAVKTQTDVRREWAGGFQTPPDLIEYYGWLRSASEHKKLEQLYLVESRLAQNASARHKLMLALILSLPDTTFVDYTRARRLLYDYARTSEYQSEEDRNLAQLVRDLLDELEWVNASSGRSKQSTLAMRKENAALQSQVNELSDEIARLQAQFEQLKQIEHTITETQRSVNIPTPAAAPTPEQNEQE